MRSVEERKLFLARLPYRFGCVGNLFLLSSLSLSLWLRYPTVFDPPIPWPPDPPWRCVMEFVMPCVGHLPKRGFCLWTLKSHCESKRLSHEHSAIQVTQLLPLVLILPGTCLIPKHPLPSCFLQKLPGNDFCLSKSLEFISQGFHFPLRMTKTSCLVNIRIPWLTSSWKIQIKFPHWKIQTFFPSVCHFWELVRVRKSLVTWRNPFSGITDDWTLARLHLHGCRIFQDW